MANLERTIESTTNELILRDTAKCARCGRTDELTIDHIIPLMVLQYFGIERIKTYRRLDWLQLLCRLCNALKSSRIDWQDPRSKKIMMELLETV